jgi:hypothetical protein
MNATVDEDEVARGLVDLFQTHEGIVCGGNDFLYTSHMEQHPCAYFLYRYAPLLASLGVDTIFLENHYVSEPIQTRGFLGYIMYCAYRFGFRVVGLEFKGAADDYHRYTGQRPRDLVTTIAYDERNRVVRLNMVADDLRRYLLHPSVWTRAKGRRAGKYVLFCGMSHVNDEKRCKGIKTLFGAPGLGMQFGERTRWTPKKPFHDREARYKRPTDYLVEMQSLLPLSTRLHIDSTLYTTLHDYLFFYRAYAELMRRAGRETTPARLWRKPTGVYPMEYRYMLEHMIHTDPRLALPKDVKVENVRHAAARKRAGMSTLAVRPPLDAAYEQIASLVMDDSVNICSRRAQSMALAGITDEHLDDLTNRVREWIGAQTGRELTREQYPMVMDMIFLEKKTLEDAPVERWWSALQAKFRKQRQRPEHHLFTFLKLMHSLGIALPKTRALANLYPAVRDPECPTAPPSADDAPGARTSDRLASATV